MELPDLTVADTLKFNWISPKSVSFCIAHITMACGYVWHAARMLQTVTRLSSVTTVADGSTVPVALASHTFSAASWPRWQLGGLVDWQPDNMLCKQMWKNSKAWGWSSSAVVACAPVTPAAWVQGLLWRHFSPFNTIETVDLSWLA